MAATGHSIGEWLSDATDHWHVCAECGEILDKAAHTFDDGVVTAPSCTKGGYTTYTCTVCGYSYTADETAALGHDYVAAVTAPTCTEGGYTTHTCSRCGDSYVTDEIPATGHTLGEWLSDAENHWKVCENCSGEIDKAAHTPSVWILDVPATAEATGLKHKECTVCGAVIETAVIEKIVMPDIQPGEGVPEIAVDSKTAHAGQTVDVTISLKNNPGISSMKLVVTYGAGLILKSPVVYNICSEEDPNMPYTMQPQSYASPVLLNWVSPITEMTDDTVYATLTFEIAADAEGDQDVTVFYNPKDVFNANEENVAFAVTNGKVTVAADHSFTNYVSNNDATCTADGTKTAKCDYCDVTNTITDEGSALGHDYAAVVTAPTCTEAGYTTYTCSRCGDTYVGDEIPASGHTVGEWLTDAENHWHVCEDCAETVDKAAHIASDWIIDVEATATAAGYMHKECTVCGKVLENGYIPKIVAHIPGDINGDGELNNKDLTRFFQYLSDWDVEVNEDALDVNGDGAVNNKDLTRLFQYLSDWDVEIF